MAITTEYSIISFDQNTAVIRVSVNFINSTLDVLDTKEYSITLPVDSQGNVPTGSALTDIVQSRIARENIYYPTQWTVPTTGVANSASLIAASDAIEPSEGIAVLLVPVGSSTGFTASILIATNDTATPAPGIVLRSQLITPQEFVPGDYILDNGNINGATLTAIRGAGDATSAYVNDIEITMDPATVPGGIISTYPNIFRDPLPESDPGFVFNDYIGQYYITHAPITITGTYAIAVFNY